MKYTLPLILLWILCLPAFGQTWEKISPTVQEKMVNAPGNVKALPVLVRLISPVDLDQLVRNFESRDIPVSERPRIVQRNLQQAHRHVQEGLIEQLGNKFPGKFAVHSKMWLVNMLYLEATPDVISYLSQQAEVISIHHLNDYEVIQPQPMEGTPTGNRRSPGGVEPGLAAINAPAMWALGYTGHGQRALIYDTGITPDHPAIRDRFLYHNTFGAEGWFGVDRYYPGDKTGTHGTHVSGITLGLDPQTHDTIGVAYGARFLNTDPIVTDLSQIKPLPTYVQVYEWAFNPDGDTNTTDDIPDVVNNSWGLASSDTTLCNSFASDMFEALEAASIGIVFSAGNNGPDSASTGRPAFINSGLTNVFSVGALNGNLANYPIASFSSRGPTICPGTGSLKIKPEVSAPGVSVRSSVEHDDYAYYNGTSMAAPHCTGAFLLLKEAFPYLTSKEILEAMYYSAVDLGVPGEDNTYGMGIIDVKAAFDSLAVNHVPIPPELRNNDLEVTEILEPGYTYFCDTNITVRAVVANVGINSAQNAKVRLMKEDGAVDSLVILSLAAGEKDTVTLQITSGVHLGDNEFAVRIDWAQGTPDYDIVDNQRMVRFDYRELLDINEWGRYYDFDSMATPFGGDFFIDGYQDLYTWRIDSTDAYYPEDRALMIPISEYQPRNHQRDYIYFQNTELIPDAGMRMTFRHYYKTRSTFFKDSLVVQYSADCGDTWYTALEMGDSSMITTLIDDVSNPNYWVDNTTEVYGLVRMYSVNDYGGDIYLDDIKFEGISTGLNKGRRSIEIRVTPNPASEQVLISWEGSQEGKMVVYSVDGRVMFQTRINQSWAMLNVSDWAAGVYLIQLETMDGFATRRLIVTK